jgi:hypothetical protein
MDHKTLMKKSSLLKLWSVGVGAMDAVTGLLLIFAPTFTLRLLGISTPSADATVFLGWIGVFVMSVGLSYGLAVLRPGYGVPVWIFTSLVRAAVAVFVTARILDDSLEARWIIVALTDAAVACAQILILRAGWWKEVPS